MSNRNSTPDQAASSLRPPSSRPLGSGHHLRASADMSAFPSPLGSGRIRPSSEIFLNPPTINQNPETEALDRAAQKWLADLEVYERTLEEMAAATLDQDFKDELSAIEQWFRVLSEAERTAALYALLQQTTQVQIRFFITVLQQMARSHPMSAILSPANFDKDAMSNRMNEAVAQMSLNNNRNSFNQVPPSPTTNRNPSGLDIHAMFPDAAAALAAQRAKIQGAGGSGTKSNRNSGIFESRPSSNLAPSMSTKENPPPSPWTQGPRNGEISSDQNTRPKSAADQMGQWQAPPLSAGLRSPMPQITGNTNLKTTTIAAPANNGGIEMPQLSPFDGPSGNWASMVNTPVVPMFGQAAHTNADMIANATAMKLAALSTVNNRIILDSDVGKFRRRPKNEQPSVGNQQLGRPGGPMAAPSNIVMYNEHGQPVQIPAAAAAAAVVAHQNAHHNQNQNMSPFGRRSPRSHSPGISFHNSPQIGLGGFGSPQNNGFLAADYSSPLMSGGAFGLGQFGGISSATEGYLSDEPSTARGRSPRSRRGTSKPPEDPTDPALLADISQWLRSQRLHKYTDNLKDLKWQELVTLSDEDLEKRGVNALGARRKMLKVFEQVNEAIKEGKLSIA